MISEEQKADWVKALRSGRYKQGQSFLCQKREGKFYYCCLGVLVKRLGMLEQFEVGYQTIRYGAPTRRISAPFNAVTLAGVKGLDGRALIKSGDALKLINMNDGTEKKPRKNFKEIADWIEENLRLD